MQLGGKVALITGAGSGLGKAAALLSAREGAKVVALDLAGDELDETAGQIRGRRGEALPLASDTSRHISGTEVWIDGAQSLLRG